jgi:hypothetical protein
MLTRSTLLRLLRDHRLAVVASTALDGRAQAAAVGIAVTDSFEIVFDTLSTSRKARNFARDPRVAMVIGGMQEGEEETVQLEGLADVPEGAELERLKELYYQTWPDGRERLRWPGLIYVRVRPQWLRYSDYRSDPPVILEFDATRLAALD